MQEHQFEAMVERVAEKVPGAREAIHREFAAVRDSGQLLTLNTEEVNLLEDYRGWKRTSDAASGLFHWKRRK